MAGRDFLYLFSLLNTILIQCYFLQIYNFLLYIYKKYVKIKYICVIFSVRKRVWEKGCDFDMEQDIEYRQNLVQRYRREIEPLLRYLPWLKQNAGRTASSNYQRQNIGSNSISFPVYDSSLMGFVREAARTGLMNRNYPYVYTRNRIRNHEDERKLIERAELKDWDMLCGILSKYVMGGRTRATLWSEAVQENIFLLVLERMRRITAFWDRSGKI